MAWDAKMAEWRVTIDSARAFIALLDMREPIPVMPRYLPIDVKMHCHSEDLCAECFADGFDEKLNAGFCFYHSPSATQLAAEVADEMAEQAAEQAYLVRRDAGARFTGHLARQRLLADEAKAEKVYAERAVEDADAAIEARAAQAAEADAIYDKMVERLFVVADRHNLHVAAARRRKVMRQTHTETRSEVSCT